MAVEAEKIPGGYRIDGLEIKSGKCGCTSVLPCCHSWSKVKQRGTSLEYTGKASGPDSADLFSWGYTVTKDGFVVSVRMEDARDKTIFSGYYPPALEEWLAKGWRVVEQEGGREDFGLWRCAACKWLYKEQKEGRPFDDLPNDWRCPVCKAGKAAFEKVG